MEYGSITREIHVDATPEVVFTVVSSPEHVQQWWSDEAEFEPVPGASGELAWNDGATPRAHVAPMTVVEAAPPRLFSFRWCHSGAGSSTASSLLVTFELTPSRGGTLIRLTETGFREMGWEAAVLEEQYRDHVAGWDVYFPRLGEYVTQLVATP